MTSEKLSFGLQQQNNTFYNHPASLITLMILALKRARAQTALLLNEKKRAQTRQEIWTLVYLDPLPIL
jgi:hypothetical protein